MTSAADQPEPGGDRHALRTVFMGTSKFAATVLRALASSPHVPTLVVTPPDRRRGRGRTLQSPPAAQTARELGLELAQVASVNDPESLARIHAAAPDAGVVCAFGQLIKEPLLSDPVLLNIHPSLLPRWRGAAPIERAIMAGDRETGVTIMRVTAGLDSGPIALQQRTPIEPGEDFGSLSARLASLGGELIARALGKLATGQLSFAEQDEASITYAEKIGSPDRRLDPARAATELEATVRALTPHIGAYLELPGGERLGVRQAHAQPGSAEAGSLVAGDELLLGCGEGILRLEVVQPSGRKPMAAEAYMRGHVPPARAL